MKNFPKLLFLIISLVDCLVENDNPCIYDNSVRVDVAIQRMWTICFWIVLFLGKIWYVVSNWVGIIMVNLTCVSDHLIQIYVLQGYLKKCSTSYVLYLAIKRVDYMTRKKHEFSITMMIHCNVFLIKLVANLFCGWKQNYVNFIFHYHRWFNPFYVWNVTTSFRFYSSYVYCSFWCNWYFCF